MDSGSTDNPDSTIPLLENHPELSQFIENMGLHYEDYGLARIAGRILGLLLLSPRPVSSDEMTEVLQVSRSSISTNLRNLLLAELVEKVPLPGLRADYYTISAEAWQNSLEMRLANIFPLKELAEQGLEWLSTDHPARPRLKKMIVWVDMVHDAMERIRSEWQSREEAFD